MNIVVFQPETGEYRLSFKLDKRDLAVVNALLVPTAFVGYTYDTPLRWTVDSNSRPIFKYMASKTGIFQDMLYLASIAENNTIESCAMTAQAVHEHMKQVRKESKIFKATVNDNLFLLDIKVKLV